VKLRNSFLYNSLERYNLLSVLNVLKLDHIYKLSNIANVIRNAIIAMKKPAK